MSPARGQQGDGGGGGVGAEGEGGWKKKKKAQRQCETGRDSKSTTLETPTADAAQPPRPPHVARVWGVRSGEWQQRQRLRVAWTGRPPQPLPVGKEPLRRCGD